MYGINYNLSNRASSYLTFEDHNSDTDIRNSL